MVRGFLNTESKSEEDAIASLYDAGDLGHILIDCPSIDGLLEVIAQNGVPESQTKDAEAQNRWRAFADKARSIKERRSTACDE